MTERSLWHCPKCGARLVTRNLWHSCGRFTLEALFSGSTPEILAAARKYVALLESLGDVQVLPQKTRLVAVARVRFAGLYPHKNDFLASFALHRWLTSPRIVKATDYGPRWRAHFVRIASADDLDDELLGVPTFALRYGGPAESRRYGDPARDLHKAFTVEA